MLPTGQVLAPRRRSPSSPSRGQPSEVVGDAGLGPEAVDGSGGRTRGAVPADRLGDHLGDERRVVGSDAADTWPWPSQVLLEREGLLDEAERAVEVHGALVLEAGRDADLGDVELLEAGDGLFEERPPDARRSDGRARPRPPG